MKKYIRTKDGIFELMFPNEEHQMSFDYKTIEPAYYTVKNDWVAKKDVMKQADNIEKLLDHLVVIEKGNSGSPHIKYKFLGYLFLDPSYDEKFQQNKLIVYGAIWTDAGLIYKAKMNEKGDWVLL